VTFFWETLTCLYSTGNLGHLLPFLTTTTNWGEKNFFPTTWLLGLYQHNYFLNSAKFLTFSLLIFLLIMIHVCWCPLILTILLLSHKCVYLLENEIGHLIFLSENTLMVISTHKWSSVYSEITVDVAVDRFVVAVIQVIETAFPALCIKKCQFPVWVSCNLKYYIRENN
jgi:hypothetical protein